MIRTEFVKGHNDFVTLAGKENHASVYTTGSKIMGNDQEFD